MSSRIGVAVSVLLLAAVVPTVAQTTGMPSYSSPYRVFSTHEFGAALSFPGGNGGVGVEGLYGFGKGKFDVGLRGGLVVPDDADTRFLVGVNGRHRVFDHSEAFPLDGAVTLGVGAHFGDGTQLYIPAALSIGRRINVEDSEVSIVPYVQPTLYLTEGSDQGLDAHFTLGIGGDFKLSRMFEARLSFGLGDLEGLSIGAVWFR